MGSAACLAGCDLSTDRLYGDVKVCKGRSEFLLFCRYIRSSHPGEARIAIVLDNFSSQLSTKKDQRAGIDGQAVLLGA